jgi:hypothetical protein
VTSSRKGFFRQTRTYIMSDVITFNQCVTTKPKTKTKAMHGNDASSDLAIFHII